MSESVPVADLKDRQSSRSTAATEEGMGPAEEDGVAS